MNGAPGVRMGSRSVSMPPRHEESREVVKRGALLRGDPCPFDGKRMFSVFGGVGAAVETGLSRWGSATDSRIASQSDTGLQEPAIPGSSPGCPADPGQGD